ncbi:hypothetical protein [Pseudomonas serbica]|jgi:hypothetical protein|uniref:hypothetical protein n=1 Tax=Pseudomonas serbica TaxID=2965074 RepID=UPI00237A17CE|nr:hypothetical protein [Pseudomonas serbica]
MIVLKLLALACALFALLVFVRVLLQDDPKFGKYNWKVALACAGFSTVLMVLACLEFIVSIPLRLYFYLQSLSSKGKP